MGIRRFPIIFNLICVAWLFAGSALLGQPRVQLPSESPIFPSTSPNVGGGVPYTGSPVPYTGAPYGTAPTYSTPAATSFDPYFRPSTPAPMFNSPNWNLGNLFNYYWGQTSAPVIPLGPANYPTYIPPGTTPSLSTPQTFSTPQMNPGSQPPGYYPPGYYPNSIYPNNTPNVLFPGTGNPTQYTNGNYYNPYVNPSLSSLSSSVSYGTSEVVRLCQGARLRQTWLNGNSDFNSLEINDTDVSLVFAIPDFLNSTRSFYIIPSYSHHLWDGPRVVGSDLPSKAFSGFLDFGWDTNPQQTLGLELGGRIGVFADFDAVNSDSVRYQGKLLGRLRLTPTSTFRLGVFYLDRNKIKLLPAGGLLWTPNQDSRFDIFFPEPKISHYVSTLGNKDMWWYLHGYYGGGNWTIQRTDQTEDEVDINDIRIMIGLEFGRSEQIRQGYRCGFVELGYAFNRELIFRHNSANNLELEDSIVVRAGLAY